MFQIEKRRLLIDKRDELGVSQNAVAIELGVSQSYYSSIELGYIKPNPKIAEKIIQLFGLPEDYFSGR